MLMANSDVSSSILPRSPLIPNSIETLDVDNESSSQIASIEAHVVNVQSLALSSPNRDRDRDNHDSLSIPPPLLDGYTSSSSSDETQFFPSPVNLDHDEFDNESRIRIGINSQALDDINDVLWDACSSDDLRELNPWTPNVSPGYGSDDDNFKKECTKPLLGFGQEPLKIEEPITGVVCSDFVLTFVFCWLHCLIFDL